MPNKPVTLKSAEIAAFTMPAPGHTWDHAFLRQLQARLADQKIELNPRDVHDIRDAAKALGTNYQRQFAALLSAVDRRERRG